MDDIFVFVEHFEHKVDDITYVGLAQAQALAKALGNKVVAVLLADKTEPLTKELLADEVIAIEGPSLAEFLYDEYVVELSDVIRDHKPRIMLFGDTAIGSDLAGGLSARLNLPLVSFCKEIKAKDGKLRFSSQICGGKIFVEGELPATTALVTLLPGQFKAQEGQAKTPPAVHSIPFPETTQSRIKLKEIIHPLEEDVDITQEEILVGIGRGVENEDNVSLARELAEALGGNLCASRPVIDQGWLPTSRLVGKSGKTVKPKLYLALGISGAPEHVQAIEESETIIAVNTDPNAPIFNLATYGTTEDLLDITEELIQSIQEAKGG